MANGLRASIRVEDAPAAASPPSSSSGRRRAKKRGADEQHDADVDVTVDVDADVDESARRRAEQRAQEVERAANDPASRSSKIIETKTTTTTTTTTTQRQRQRLADELGADRASGDGRGRVAVVEHLGKRATEATTAAAAAAAADRAPERQTKTGAHIERTEIDETTEIEGNKLVTTVSTVGAQCGQSRIVLALLKEGDKFQMKVQEMRPPIFEVGFNRNECNKYNDEHQRMLASLRRQESAPIEAWLQKYQKIRQSERQMSNERQLIYLCMLENLQACWRASLRQLDKRAQLLELACSFYELAERVAAAIERAEAHVQTFRLDFLNGLNSKRFAEARGELQELNRSVVDAFELAKQKQQQLIELIRVIASGNLGDARVNHLISDAQNLINYIATYLDPLQKRRLQLESVLKTTTTDATTHKTTIKTTTMTNTNTRALTAGAGAGDPLNRSRRQPNYSDGKLQHPTGGGGGQPIREIANLNDLHYVDNWLSLKIEQLNSSLLSSLGVGVAESRTILGKHEQILLECRTIEEAALLFKGKNIHALKSAQIDPAKRPNRTEEGLFEQQRALSSRAADVITILEARIALLRRTIDFHVRSKEATGDIGKMMRRLQVDNSLQSVEFVANELELKDVSSVVASGATIISELQQLQLAQQHGQRSNLVNLNLVTSGIRMAIDQLNQELAHLKTVLGQRKLVLLNEDRNKMANSFSQKCNQLHFWLQNHVKSFLLANNQLALDAAGASQFWQSHQRLRSEVQRKTLEVEALLRSLSWLRDENFDAKSKLAETIQRSVDELRQEWILVTNCLERRAELARKYLGLLETAALLDRELGSLQSFRLGAKQPDRSDEEIRANIELASQQLSRQLQQLRLDAQRAATELRCGRREQPAAEPPNELNKAQLLEQAERLFGQLATRKRALLEGRPARRLTADGPPAAARQQAQQQQQQPAAAKGEPIERKLKPPRFKRTLADKWAPAFSSVELECELERADEGEGNEAADEHGYQLEWLMNNFRKIPASIRHSASRDGHKHRLTLHSFGPQCCGTFLARAWNSAGQAVSRCELRLAGAGRPQPQPQQDETTKSESSLLAHRWPPANRSRFDADRQRPASVEKKAMARIVQGVESLAHEQGIAPLAAGATTTTNTNTTTSSTTGHLPGSAMATTAAASSGQRPALTESRYSGRPLAEQPGRLLSASECSPASSAALSRSISRSPFEGSPQAPKFVQPLCQSMSPCCSRAGLLCVVVANPPPTIEWLHNNETVAVAKCPARGQQQSPAPSGASNNKRANICKLTIETLNEQTSGQYTCRASNRLGQASSNSFTLSSSSQK